MVGRHEAGASFEQEGLLEEHPSTPDVRWPRILSTIMAFTTLGCGLGSLLSPKWVESTPTSSNFGINYTWSLISYCYVNGALGTADCLTGYGSSFNDWPSVAWQMTLIMLCFGILFTALSGVTGMVGLCKLCVRPDWHGSVFGVCGLIAFISTVFIFPIGLGSTVKSEYANGVKVCAYGGVYKLGGRCSLEWGYKLLLITLCVSLLALTLLLTADRMVVLRNQRREIFRNYKTKQKKSIRRHTVAAVNLRNSSMGISGSLSGPLNGPLSGTLPMITRTGGPSRSKDTLINIGS
eukprot:Ihof_evm13s109 gene=Ihof_evmTU13s109